jgi:CheY-like chemotaxis protein
MIRVLVADDSRLSRRTVIKSLPPEVSVEITEASDGNEAIALLAKEQFKLLLLDLTMPGADGVAVLQYVQDNNIDTDVIVISADFQPEKQRIVMSLGAKRFLRKPLNNEEMAMTLFELGYL